MKNINIKTSVYRMIQFEDDDTLKTAEEKFAPKRWFDYRDLPAAFLDKFFFFCYVKAYVQYHAKVGDVKEAGLMELPPFLVFDSNVYDSTLRLVREQRLVLTKARHCADAIGCKYPFYISRAFKRNLDFGWHYCPEFKHLVYDEVRIDVGTEWLELKKNTLQLGHPKWMSKPTLAEYHGYLLGIVCRFPASIRLKVLHRLMSDGHLPENSLDLCLSE